MTLVKICGLTDPDLVRYTAQAGADWIGFVFAEASPRHVTEAAAANLLMQVGSATPVALLVDPDDAQIDRIVALGFRYGNCTVRNPLSASPKSRRGRVWRSGKPWELTIQTI